MTAQRYPPHPEASDNPSSRTGFPPFPEPKPEPVPIPIPEPFPHPPDHWRCRRSGPVSGRYAGEMTSPNPGRSYLDLRVDIDPRYANSPIMDRVSGDLYKVFQFRLPFRFFKKKGRIFRWKIYKKSWIVDKPIVKWERCQVEITGRVRFWKRRFPKATIQIIIPWGTFKPVGPATVRFTTSSGDVQVYACPKRSVHFRDILLEVDVCQSVNQPPILPSYDTRSHPIRPTNIPQRILTIEEAYREAGIDLTINPTRTIIDDSHADFNRWSVAELHDAMEEYFSQISGGWPKWHTWCLLAGSFDRLGVGGIMFDAAAIYGGAGEAPERQGCAVFRNHNWFSHLVSNPTTDAEAASMRHYLYTCVHEIGHGFNHMHSWDKGREESLSWMNYDWRYDDLKGDGQFWSNFLFCFDDQELIHLRHGDRAAVIPGGDPWASGTHLESPEGADADLVGMAPLELTIRSKEFFQFMEPISIELRLKNLTDIPFEIDTELHPEYGGVMIFIRRPDGRTLKYSPVLCKLSTPTLGLLKPLSEGLVGEDRHSQNLMLSYGSDGFYFDDPGEYLVRALYQGPGDIMLSSNLHRIRIGHPYSREEERIAQDYFAYQTGMALYVNGSSSPHLEKGMKAIQEVADQYRETSAGAHLSLVLAKNLKKPFFRVLENKLEKTRDANPVEALSFTERAMEQQVRDARTFTNIGYHDLRHTRAMLLADTGKTVEAEKEVDEMVLFLKENGVNQPVLDQIATYKDDIRAMKDK